MESINDYLLERLNPKNLGPILRRGRPVPDNLIQHNKLRNSNWKRYILSGDICQDEFDQIFDQYEIRDWDAMDALIRTSHEVNYDMNVKLWDVKDKVLNRSIYDILDDLDAGESLWYLVCIAGKNGWQIVF